MSYRYESLFLAPGLVLGCLDSGGMIIDRDSGEYVPADQVIRDPLHIDQLDCLADSHLGGIKLGRLEQFDEEDDDISAVEADDADEAEDLPAETQFRTPEDDEDELYVLIEAQRVDMLSSAGATVRVTSTKGAHVDFGTEKRDNDYRGEAHGSRGRQLYKDRRLRALGSGKTTARNATL